MAGAEGVALAPWGIVAGGKIRTDEEEQRRCQTSVSQRSGFAEEPDGPDYV